MTWNVVALGLAGFVALGCIHQVRHPLPYSFASAWSAVVLMVWNLADCIVMIALGQVPWAVLEGFCVLYCALDLFNRHRDRMRRLAGAIGEKARQRRAALVRTLRERGRPRPILKPGLQGAS